MVRQLGLHLVSKRRDKAARYVPDEGPDAGRGPRRKSGKQLDDRHLPGEPVQVTSIEAGIKTQRYQMSLWHKTCAALRNVVVIVETNLHTHNPAHVVWFSSDLTLSYGRLIDSSRVRFQREFNGRDAKPYWGLEDFMSVNERPGYNRANLARFMVNVSHALIRPMRTQWPAFSVSDLKAWCRGRKSVVETFKLLPERPDALFIDQVVFQMAVLGRVNHAVNPA